MTKLEKKIAIIHSIANFVGIKIEIDQIVDGCVMYTIHPNAIYIPPFNRNDLPYILFLAVTKVWEIFNELPFSWRNFSKDATPLEVFYEGAFCREEVEFREKSHEIIMILNEAGCDLLDKKYQDVICIAKNRLASICKSDIDVIKAVDIGFKEDGYITFEWYKDKDNVKQRSRKWYRINKESSGSWQGRC